MVISEHSFLWILILLSFTEFFSSKASNEIKVNHPGCLSSFKYPPNPIYTVKSQVQSRQVKSSHPHQTRLQKTSSCILKDPTSIIILIEQEG